MVVDDAVVWNDRTRAYFDNSQPWAQKGGAATEDHALAFSLWNDLDHMARLQQRVQRQFPLRCMTVLVPYPDGSDQAYLEILPAAVDKWTGLTRLATHLGLPLQAICAVGDAANDLPMIRQAAWGGGDGQRQRGSAGGRTLGDGPQRRGRTRGGGGTHPRSLTALARIKRLLQQSEPKLVGSGFIRDRQSAPTGAHR